MKVNEKEYLWYFELEKGGEINKNRKQTTTTTKKKKKQIQTQLSNISNMYHKLHRRVWTRMFSSC